MRLAAGEVADVGGELSGDRGRARGGARGLLRRLGRRRGASAASPAKVPIAMVPGASLRRRRLRGRLAAAWLSCRRESVTPRSARHPGHERERRPLRVRPRRTGRRRVPGVVACPVPRRPAWAGGAPVPMVARPPVAGCRRVGGEQLPEQPLQLGTRDPPRVRRRSPAAPARTYPAPRPAARRPPGRASAAPRTASRSGCSPTRLRSSGITCAARPQARSASMRSSVAASRSSSARSACVASSEVRGTSASSGPRHSPSASPSSAAARPRRRRPARSCLGDQRLEHLDVQVLSRPAACTRAPGRGAPGPRCRR